MSAPGADNGPAKWIAGYPWTKLLPLARVKVEWAMSILLLVSDKMQYSQKHFLVNWDRHNVTWTSGNKTKNRKCNFISPIDHRNVLIASVDTKVDHAF